MNDSNTKQLVGFFDDMLKVSREDLIKSLKEHSKRLGRTDIISDINKAPFHILFYRNEYITKHYNKLNVN